MFTNQLMVLVAIGLLSGLASGIFGIGGGVILVPALIYLAGFSQHRATGTSLAVLLPPIGLAATIEYYVHGTSISQRRLFSPARSSSALGSEPSSPITSVGHSCV